jgi:hypothetical protein
MGIGEKIRKFHGEIERDGHHRYRSWEHCYRYFRGLAPSAIIAQRDTAALQLGFYLARWGMYRGSSFLLQRAYTAHLGLIDRLAGDDLRPLWQCEFGTAECGEEIVGAVESAVAAVREAYAPFGQATDTLVTKVLLGTLGCLPAVDRYFIDGFKAQGQSYSRLNRRFIDRIRAFSIEHLPVLRAEQRRIEGATGVRYPLMKLIDMYFWQIGYERDAAADGTPPPE